MGFRPMYLYEKQIDLSRQESLGFYLEDDALKLSSVRLVKVFVNESPRPWVIVNGTICRVRSETLCVIAIRFALKQVR